MQNTIQQSYNDTNDEKRNISSCNGTGKCYFQEPQFFPSSYLVSCEAAVKTGQYYYYISPIHSAKAINNTSILYVNMFILPSKAFVIFKHIHCQFDGYVTSLISYHFQSFCLVFSDFMAVLCITPARTALLAERLAMGWTTKKLKFKSW